MQANLLDGYFVYALMNRDHLIYIGYTSTLLHRLEMHNSNGGAMATKNRGPWYLFYVECYAAEIDARTREAEIVRAFESGIFLKQTYWSRAAIQIQLGLEHSDWTARIINNTAQKG